MASSNVGDAFEGSSGIQDSIQ
jgi:hypothetical protein